MALQRQLRVLGRRIGAAHVPFVRGQAASIVTHTKAPSDAKPLNGDNLLTAQAPKTPTLKPTLPQTTTVRPNPWDVLTPFLTHAAFVRPPTPAQVASLLQCVYQAQRGQDMSAALGRWCSRWQGGDLSSDPRSEAAKPSDVNAELIRAHTSMAHIKHKLARGHYAGRQNVAHGWRVDAQAGKLLAATLADARRRHQPGVVLNLLLESQAQVNQSSNALGWTTNLRSAVESARDVYKRLVVGTAHSGVWDALWRADNVRAAVTALQRMVQGREIGADKVFDRVAAEVALALMQAARLCNDAASVHTVFTQCNAWLRSSTSAYNILLYTEARAYDAKAAVHVLKQMRAAGVRPDVHTWTTLMRGMLAAGRIDLATKLFALHLDFLPRPPADHAVQPDDTKLYAPEHNMLSGAQNLPGNLWEEWYAEDLRRGLDPFVTSWLKDLAIEMHEGAGKVRERHERIRTMRGRRSKQQVELPTPESPLVPWLPTLATHRLILRALFRAQRTAQVVAYFALLRRVWPQYCKWAGEPEDGPDGGLDGLERMLHGHLAQVVPRVRTLHGLTPVADTTAAGSAAAVAGSYTPYYRHCSDILRMIADIGTNTNTGRATNDNEPVDRLVYAKALHAYALQGDMTTVLHHMRRYQGFNDVAVWTEVVRCICEQIRADPHDAELLFPYGFDMTLCRSVSATTIPPALLKSAQPSWIGFVLIMAAMLASRGVHFNHVSYGIIVQTAAHLGDLHSVVRVVQYMHEHSPERFNVEMLRMVLASGDLSFFDKCRLVRRVLDVNYYNDGKNKDALRLARASTMNVNARLQSFVVNMASEPQDIQPLRSLVEFIVQRYGIRLRDHDYDHIINTCRRHAMHEDIAYWIEHRHRLDMYY